MIKARLIFRKKVIVGMIVFMGILTSCVPEANDELSVRFQDPPASARPFVWWHWMSGNISRKGITADLEAMAEAGIGGAWIFNLGESHGCEVPPGPIDYMSDEWMEMLKLLLGWTLLIILMRNAVK